MTPDLKSPSPSATRKSRAGRDLPAAIGVGVLLAAAVVLTLRFWHWGFVGLTVIALCLGAIEVHQALQKIGMKSAIVPIVIGTVAMIAGSYTAAINQDSLLPWHAVLLAFLGATVLAALIWRMPQGHEGYIRDSAASLFIIGYIALLGSFTGLILAGDHGGARMTTFLLCVMASDTGGYAVGALIGRHPMSPTISPKKTWEGLAGSFGLASIVGSLLAVFALRSPWWVGAILGVAMVVFGTCGDLIESLVKRDVGIKDMSSFLPGHGGVMDRLDSILVAAPAAWLVMFLLVPGG